MRLVRFKIDQIIALHGTLPVEDKVWNFRNSVIELIWTNIALQILAKEEDNETD